MKPKRLCGTDLAYASPRQEIRFVDATPDADYPARILRAYIDAGEVRVIGGNKNLTLLADGMNDAIRKRNALLEKAIARIGNRK